MPTDMPRITFAVNNELYEKITDYKFRHRFKNQTQAILDLIDKGIEGFVEDGVIPRPQIKDPMIEKYNALDEYGKKAVSAILEIEYARALSAMQIESEPPAMVDKIVYDFPSAAGIPMYADDDFEHLEFPADQVPKDADFGIRIKGDSMEPTIPDGTIVWVRKESELYDGQIGVFMIDDSAVCKRFYKEGDVVQLKSDNNAYEPIMIHDYERFGIVGRVLEYK